MENKKVSLTDSVGNNYYRLNYRCSNCGIIFEYDMKNGIPVTSMNGICPNCKIKSGTVNVGVFPVIKLNPKYDEGNHNYFR